MTASSSSSISIALPRTTFLIQSTENFKYLPNGISKTLTRLAYLTHFQNNSERSPFTEEQGSIFLNAKKWTRITGWSLKLGFAASAALPITPVLLALKKIQAWENESNSNTALLVIIFILYAGSIGAINYFCSALWPVKAGRSSTEALTEVFKASKTYEELGYRLLELYERTPEAAKEIASNLNIENIQAAMETYIHPDLAKELCSPLWHAAHAVVDDELHEDAPPLIATQWRSIQLEKRLNNSSRPYANKLIG